MHEKDGEGRHGVVIETELQHTGWAVFEGDEVRFVAYFADYDRAQAYIDMCAEARPRSAPTR